MLKNKIIFKRIRNICILVMAVAILVGAYTYVRRSRAENVIQVELEVSDKSEILETQKMIVEATETEDGNYLLDLPTSVNGFIVTKYYRADGSEVDMIDENADKTFILTETDVTNQPIQLQTDYDKKDVTTEDGQTITLYNKELMDVKDTEEDANAENPEGADNETQENETQTTETTEEGTTGETAGESTNESTDETENEEQTTDQKTELDDTVVVTGYMPLESQVDIQKMDVSTMNVQLPSDTQTIQDAYEVSVYQTIRKTVNPEGNVISEEVVMPQNKTENTESDTTAENAIPENDTTARNENTQNENTNTQENIKIEDINSENAKENENVQSVTEATTPDNTTITTILLNDGTRIEEEKIEYDPSVYNEQLTIKTKNSEENTTATIYELQDDNQVIPLESTTEDDYVDTTIQKDNQVVRLALATEPISQNETEPNSLDSDSGIATMALTDGNMLMKVPDNERGGNSPFLGNSNIKRMYIENVTFLSSTSGANSTAWDVSAEQNGSIMAWYEITNQIGDFSFYKVYIGSNEKIYANTDSSYLFNNLANDMSMQVTEVITNIDLLDTSKVTNMQGMFRALTQGSKVSRSFDLGDNFDTSNVTNMKDMFSYMGLSSLTSLNLGDKFDTRNVTNMDSMFANCGRDLLTSLNLGGSFVKIADSHTDMFTNTGLSGSITIQVPETIYRDSHTFRLNSSSSTTISFTRGTLVSIPALIPGTPPVTGPGTLRSTNPSRENDKLGPFLGNASIQRQNIENVTFVSSTSGMNSTAWDVSEEQNRSIMAWYTTNPNGTYKVYIGSDFTIYANPDSTYLFAHIGYSSSCTATETITNLNLLNTSKVTDMRAMFWDTGYAAMTSLDLGDNFDTSKVTNMSGMFWYTGYTAMTRLDLGDNFDTSKVTNMVNMFAHTGYTAMTSLELGDKFDTSNVTNMRQMFQQAGYNAMTSLNLGDKFDTSRVTDMSYMFEFTGLRRMTSLDLGDNFDTSNVTDMSYMFDYTGQLSMTNLDLGPAFTDIASTNTGMFSYTGSSGVVIQAPEAIYDSRTSFKLGTNSSTTISFTNGTINPKYRTEWIKEGVQTTTTSGSNPTLRITLRGTTNSEVSASEYASNVTSALSISDIKIFIDDTDITNSISKSLGSATRTYNSSKGTYDVTQVLTLLNFEESTIRTGKNYKEWSGNIRIEIPQGTLTDTYGNKNMELASDGSRDDHNIKDATTDRNTANTLFADFIKPNFTYNFSSTDIDRDAKTLTVNFSVTDKYFNSSTISSNASNIVVRMADTNTVPENLTTSLRKVQDITETRNGASVKVGEKYELVISGFEQASVDNGKYTEYSGPVSIAFPTGMVTDKSGNRNDAKTITVGIDEPDGTGDEEIVDFIRPEIEKIDSSIDVNAKTATLTFRVTDKYVINSNPLETGDVQILVNGSPVTVNGGTGVSVALNRTELTEQRVENGVTSTVSYGWEYRLEIRNFDTSVNQIKVRIPAGAITDTSGNGNKQTDFMLLNTLRSTSTETEVTSAFLGNTSIQRQNVDNVTFVDYVPEMVMPSESSLVRSYDATNNTGNGHSNSTTTWKDLSGNQDETINGATWSGDYLSLDGTDDWVNLGEVDLTNEVTLDVTIKLNEIQSGRRCILANYDTGGVGLHLTDGVPKFHIYIADLGYVQVEATETLTVGEKTRITGTYNGTTLSLYVNGELVAQLTQPGTIGKPENNTVMSIGVNPSGSDATDMDGYANMDVYSASVYDEAMPTNIWDVSAEQDGSIVAWYEENANGTYKVYIGSNGDIYGNVDSSNLFSYIGSSKNCTSTETITNIGLLNVSNVTNMGGMFRWTGATAMTSLNLGDNFDTSNVTSMEAMFYNTGVNAMTNLDLGNKFDTSNVTLMGAMFMWTGNYAMTSLDLGDKFDTSNVTSMGGMFQGTGKRMDSLNLGDKFDTSNVTTMSYMFSELYVTTLNLGDKFDTSNVTNMEEMFSNMESMTSLDLGENFDTSNVTNMADMFYRTGYTAMTSLDLGDKFDTSNVTNMINMFYQTGYTAMTSLDLGDKFDTSNVTNMGGMFRWTGSTAMTSLDVGPAFTNIASTNTNMFSNTGKSGEIVIQAPEAIYQNSTNFKLNTNSSTIISFTRGTINPKYRTEWVKETVQTDMTNANNPKLNITLRGTTNTEVASDEYISNVTSSLTINDIKIFIDDTEITDIVTKSLGSATTTSNTRTGAQDVLQVLTLSNFEEVSRQTGKSYKEWSGNIRIEVAQGTLTDTTSPADENGNTVTYGNSNMDVSEGDTTGTRIDNIIEDETKLEQNTTGAMFVDFIKPEFTYTYSSTDIDQDTETLTVEFSVTDKYFNTSTGLTNANGITVKMLDTNAVPENLTKTLTKVEDINETRNGQEVKIGEKYRLVVSGFEQASIENGKYKEYSGPVSIVFPTGIVSDKSGNTNAAKTITVGINEPDQTGDAEIVDFVDPMWEAKNINIDAANDKITVELYGTDKYYENNTLDVSKIKVIIDGEEITSTTNVTKQLSAATPLTETRDGTTAQYGVKYTLTISNFTETDSQWEASGRIYREYSGNTELQIAADTLVDESGNTNQLLTVDLGKIDTLSPEIKKVSSTVDEANKKETIVFDVVDKDLSTVGISTTDTSKIHVYVDEDEATSVTKKITNVQDLTATINGSSKVVGKRYTLELTNFEQPRTTVDYDREYTDWSGDVSITIDAGTARDGSGNVNEETTIEGDFVDFINPDVTYQYSDTDIDQDGKAFTMVFDITDKYYNSATLALEDLTILIDGEEPDWTEVNKSLAVEDRINTVNGESKVIGQRYTLTLSNLEQLQVKEGDNYLDYSGVVIVAIPANKVVDTKGNGNDATTLTSGISLPGGTGTGDVVDVVRPLVEKISSNVDVANKTATLTFKVTDKYFANSTLTGENIQVMVNGSVATGITKQLTSTPLNEQRVVNGMNSTVQYGVQYTLTLTGLDTTVNQIKLRVPEGLVTDQSGNENKETDLLLFNTLRNTSTETKATSAFLGNTSIQRQNVDNVTFVDYVPEMVMPSESALVRSYDATNNTGNGHSNSTTTWKDLSGNHDGTINGATWSGDYLSLDGTDDWVNLGEVDLTNEVTLDVTIKLNEIQSGGRIILCNYDNGGAGIHLTDGIPQFQVYIADLGYVSVAANETLTIGEKTRITGTYDGTTLSLYVNGKLVSQSTQEGTIGVPANNTVMAIGTNPSENSATDRDGHTDMNVYSASVYDEAMPTNIWDVSAQQDGSIVAWSEPSANDTVKVYIGSNGDIYGNVDSSYLFSYIGGSSNCTSTETITNINLLNTSNVTNMKEMFANFGESGAITSLDLGDNFDTSNVTNMNAMFTYTGYHNMVTLDLGDKFDTSSVTDMSNMFNRTGYTAMTSLDLGDKFDTSNVTDMSYMFARTGYTAMTSLDLGDKFDTSKVTNMSYMFQYTGYTAMTSLDLGDKFDTSKVTNMSYMFQYTGYTAMISLDLGDKFDTSNVTNMQLMFCFAGNQSLISLDLGDKFNTKNVLSMHSMFYGTGERNLTNLDLGPAFTYIASTNNYIFLNTGKQNEIIIQAPEAIYQNSTNFKLNTDSSTTISFTRGTINPKYRTEWIKETVKTDETDANNPKLNITLRGTTNQEVDPAEYISDVTSSLTADDIRVYIDDTEVTDIVTKSIGTATTTTNTRTGAQDVLQVVILSDFEEATRQTGKSYKEWSGNIRVEIAQGTLSDTTGSADENGKTVNYGNKNMGLADDGAREDNKIEDETKLDQNTTGAMFVDFIKPEFTYIYSSTDINYEEKTLTVEFSVTDKYFNSTTGLTNANGITVKMLDTNAVPENITKTLTKVSDINETRNGEEVKIGEEYRLVVSGFEQASIENGMYKEYSGPVSIIFPASIATDKSGNANDQKNITIGINEPDQTGDAEIVDVVTPIWEARNVNIDKENNKVTVDLYGTDKYYANNTLDVNKIKVIIDGEEVTSTTNVTKQLSVPTALTETRDGANVQYGVKYTLTLSNWKESDTVFQASEKEYREYSGNTELQIEAGTLVDESGNENIETTLDLGMIDIINPEVYQISSTKDDTAKTDTIVFEVVDKYFASAQISATDTSKLTVYVDDEEAIGVTKTITKVEDMTAIIDGTSKVIGKRYTLVISNFEQPRTTIDYDREYSDWSGDVTVKVDAGTIVDESGNSN